MNNEVEKMCPGLIRSTIQNFVWKDLRMLRNPQSGLVEIRTEDLSNSVAALFRLLDAIW
jgi:hypothetical protein